MLLIPLMVVVLLLLLLIVVVILLLIVKVLKKVRDVFGSSELKLSGLVGVPAFSP